MKETEDIKKLYECPEGCMNKDKKCMDCDEGCEFIPIINFSICLRQVGVKKRPSYAIPFDKDYIKSNGIDVSKPIYVEVTQ